MRWSVSLLAALLAIGSPLPGTPNIQWGWDYVNSKPVKLRAASDGTLATAGGGGGGGASFTVDGSTAVLGRALDTDTGAGTHNTPEAILVTPGAGGPTQTGTASSPLRTDPTGTTVQPISATSLPLPTNASQEHTTAASPNSCRLSDGAAFYNAPTSAQLPAALDGSGFLKVHEQSTIPVTKSGTWAMDQGTAAALSGAWPVKVTDGTNTMPTMDVVARAGFHKITDGTNTATVKAASTQPVTADTALVVAPKDPGNTTGTNITATAQNSDITLGGGISSLGLTTTGSWTGTITWFASHDGTNFFNITGAGPNSGGAFASFTSANGNLVFQVGSYKVVRITSSGSWTGTMTPVWNPGVGNNINGIMSFGDGNSVLKFTTKATQQTNAIPTQDMVNSGRVIKVFGAANFTAATTEALITLTPVTDGTAGSTGTSFAVTSTKRLRLGSLTCATKNAGAATQGVVVKVRMSASGAVTATSPLIAVCAAGNTGAVANQAVSGSAAFPDGIELSGTMQIGISQIGTATAGNDVTLIGFEY